MDWTRIVPQISEASRLPFKVSEYTEIAGGCINRAYRIAEGTRRYFVKINTVSAESMFAAEAMALEEIIATRSIKAPQPLCHGLAGDVAYLVMEYLDLTGKSSTGAGQLGHNLAAMHRHTRSQFGWSRDNTIGFTPQPNESQSDWVEFWREQRLGYQLRLAAGNGFTGSLRRQGDQLQELLPGFFQDYHPPASLLHGDLWGGNWGVDRQGIPVIFDPAVYYGDREADLAMTELFGGFPADFYAAYTEAYPLDTGYAQRKHLYNLYHVLNHLNLFGGAYLSQAEALIARLLAELH